MPDLASPSVAIIDFGMGNLFSVQQGCEHAGIRAMLTSSPADVMEADAAILPGVGAFGDAMANLNDLGLVPALQRFAMSSKPLVGICLGMQLLMTDSSEFGHHAGLNIVPGTVAPLQPGLESWRPLKVPHVGWNRLFRATAGVDEDPWSDTMLDGLPDGVCLYFVHSMYVRPAISEVVRAKTTYGTQEFCSALQSRNVFGCQCHPERSGRAGLRMYANLANKILSDRGIHKDANGDAR